MDEKDLAACKEEMMKIIFLSKELKVDIHLAATILLIVTSKGKKK